MIQVCFYLFSLLLFESQCHSCEIGSHTELDSEQISAKADASEFDIKIISAKELHDNYLNNDKYVLIDNRPQYKFEKGHIAGAINLPYYQDGALENVLNQETLQKLSKGKKVIFYCTGNMRAYHASVDAIKKWGVPKDRIMWFKGGMNEWLEQGYSTVS